MDQKKDLARSVRFKLLHISKKENISFQLILIRYFQERLLYRISKSKYNKNFCLKGGVLFYLYDQYKSRPTRDIDFLGVKLSHNQATLQKIFTEICNISFPPDAVTFDTQTIESNEIVQDGRYQGIRIKLSGHLGKIIQRLQIDIGFGDLVYPKPKIIKFPLIIDNEQPVIQVYSIVSVIAEKFQAMIDLADVNSRMKDFFDVYSLLKTKNINKSDLEIAIKTTFENRGTSFMENHNLFTAEFAKDKNRNIQWRAFLRKIGHPPDLEFTNIIELITFELYPSYLKLK